MENKIEHLKMIEQIIERMANKSLRMKEFSLSILAICGTLISVLSGNSKLFFFLFIPTLSFMFLDAYYLMKERTFRMLYEEVTNRQDKDIDFKMSYCKTKCAKAKKLKYMNCILSKSVLFFYLFLIIDETLLFFIV